MKKAYGILALVVVAVFGLAIVSQLAGQGDDKQKIQQALRDSLEASRKGEPGKVLDSLSGKLNVNGQEASGFGTQIASFIRKQKPDITVTNQTPIITGDEARIISPVKLQVSVPVLGEKSVTVKDVTLVFHKESAHEYLVIPVTKWRLTEVSAPPGFESIVVE